MLKLEGFTALPEKKAELLSEFDLLDSNTIRLFNHRTSIKMVEMAGGFKFGFNLERQFFFSLSVNHVILNQSDSLFALQARICSVRFCLPIKSGQIGNKPLCS